MNGASVPLIALSGSLHFVSNNLGQGMLLVQGQRGTSAESLSHADPVVQPNSSTAGAVGTTSSSGMCPF